MSQQAGIWHYDHQPVAPEQLHAFNQQLAMQGPDSSTNYQEPGLAMLHRAFFITEEDKRETQPIRTRAGNILTWDGRLDNRTELATELNLSPTATDADIVATALEAWGVKTFPKLIGDWALAYWVPREHRLLLARDYIGIRKLYYLGAPTSLYWSTDLAALVLHSGHKYTLCDAYFAGYFTNHAEPHLTPYSEIQLVPPGGYLEATPGSLRTRRYWSFNRLPSIRYKSDAEYEEHFRLLFRQSVKRRMRTAYPILADLSGGLDSSSIVCMAYDILKAGEASATINTISYYSTDEPGADERPYFMAIEDFIGKKGTHIESRYEPGKQLQPVPEPYFAPLPGYFSRMLEGEARLLKETGHQGNRMHWSGLGGDELLGGVQNPVPNLAELLWHLRLPEYARQLQAWALQRKTTIWSLAGRSLVYLLPLWMQAHLDRDVAKNSVNWLLPNFIKQQHIAYRRLRIVESWKDALPGPPRPDSGYLTLAATIAGYLPRFSLAELSGLPYYDRDLVQFLFSIPGEQLLRAHQRRSLMRRSLKSIVPEAVLSRKTKALARRTPALEILDQASALRCLLHETGLDHKYVAMIRFEDDCNKLRQGKEVATLLLERVYGTCLLAQDLARRVPNERHRLIKGASSGHLSFLLAEDMDIG